MKTNLLICLALSLGFLKSIAQENFTRITDVSPVTDRFDGAGCAFVDYDNDGFEDLFVANVSGSNYLYHNEHNGTFTALTTGDIVNEGAGVSYGAAWAVFNNDGLPDLFVANGYGTDFKPNFLYANLGGGKFQRVLSANFSSPSLSSVGVAWGDYDNDGFPDVFVTNAGSGSGVSQNNELYHNNGNG